MKKIVILLAIALGTSGMFSPDMFGRGRNNNTTSSNRPASQAPSSGRPGNNHGGQPGNRPGGNHGNHGGQPGTRPGGNHGNHGGQPGNRPGGNHGNHGGQPGNRPHTPPPRPTPPPAPHRPGPPQPHRPGGPQYGYVPPRPHVPPHYVYHRPVPPPHWRPTGPLPSFGAVLGIAFGTAIANSLNPLINSGYNVVGYTNNEIYLNNVSYANLVWPDATMHYSNGILVGSTFAYSTTVYDTSRYNYVYSNLMNKYGSPVSTQSLSNGGFSSTWWGYDNRYITLSFFPEYTSNGYMRYFTTVSLGN